MELLKKKQIHLLFLLITTLFLSSCGNLREIKVTNYKIQSIELGNRQVDAIVKLTIDNPAKSLIVSDVEGCIKMGEEVIANGQVSPFIVEGRTKGVYPITCQFSLAEGFSVLKFMSLVSSLDKGDQLTADFQAKVKVKGGIKRKFRYKDYPLKQLFRNKKLEEI